MIVTSKVPGYEGNSIFLPAAGLWTYDYFEDGEMGYYWSSSLYKNNSSRALRYSFASESVGYFEGERFCGISVRPVSD